ncbi:MAG: hypothetical protein D4R79_02370 [Comamonadaceae bacterium]|nr:MAG: hypothetical protein D4R79_02370 [Comamonadaceae bacterium]
MILPEISWLEGVSWYVAAGAALISFTYIRKRLADAAKKTEEPSGQWLGSPALTRRERLSRSLEPFGLFAVGVAIWPIFVWVMVYEKLFTVPLPPPPQFKVTREHLRDVLSIESIETDTRVTDPLGAVPDLPFGHLNPAWERLKTGMQPGDQISTFIAPWEEFGITWERGGYAVVRSGEVASFWVMRESRC